MKPYPLKLGPLFKQAIWGGTKLFEKYGFSDGSEPIAEAWMLALREKEKSIIQNGIYKGKTLEECLIGESFPLLIKLIDARDKLSVQVHPDDLYAQKMNGDSGKTEMWYIVDADEGAQIVFGLREEYTKDQLRSAINEGKLEDCLKSVPAHKGDVFFIPSGMVHAIGSGIMIAEIQQNSDVTYRLYDYNRRDNSGRLRELHIENALDVIRNFSEDEIKRLSGASREHLVNCEYFCVDLENIKGSVQICCSGGTHLLCLEGEGKINQEKIFAGDSWFLPSGGEYVLESLQGIKIIISRAKEGDIRYV